MAVSYARFALSCSGPGEKFLPRAEKSTRDMGRGNSAAGLEDSSLPPVIGGCFVRGLQFVLEELSHAVEHVDYLALSQAHGPEPINAFSHTRSCPILETLAHYAASLLVELQPPSRDKPQSIIGGVFVVGSVGHSPSFLRLPRGSYFPYPLAESARSAESP